MIILGVTHPISWNNAACLLIDGTLVAFVVEERFNPPRARVFLGGAALPATLGEDRAAKGLRGLWQQPCTVLAERIERGSETQERHAALRAALEGRVVVSEWR